MVSSPVAYLMAERRAWLVAWLVNRVLVWAGMEICSARCGWVDSRPVVFAEKLTSTANVDRARVRVGVTDGRMERRDCSRCDEAMRILPGERRGAGSNRQLLGH
ncbi:hypothetical protein EDB80DRAFT_705617 [Ilyonectria destructans]|nr:hypothetical protein EDB80DRAFT_705617 [Ilyonectria destructans]